MGYDDGARGAMLLGADDNILAKILAEAVFGKDWRPLFDWERKR